MGTTPKSPTLKLRHVFPELHIHTSVAVVGSSSILLKDNRNGREIDKFDDVIRFNRAPTEGYERFVGKKTTIRVANPHVFCCAEWKTRGWEPKGQPKDFIIEQKNCKIICIGPQNASLNFNLGKKRIHPTSKAFRYRGANFNKNGKAPTIGMLTIKLLVQHGIVPHVFGFYGLPNKRGDEGLTHYWEKRNNVSTHHNYLVEREELKKMHSQGKIVWHK